MITKITICKTDNPNEDGHIYDLTDLYNDNKFIGENDIVRVYEAHDIVEKRIKDDTADYFKINRIEFENATFLDLKLATFLLKFTHNNRGEHYYFNYATPMPVLYGTYKTKWVEKKRHFIMLFGENNGYSTRRNSRMGHSWNNEHYFKEEGEKRIKKPNVPYENLLSIEREIKSDKKQKPKIKRSWFHKDFWKYLQREDDEKFFKRFNSSYKSPIYLKRIFGEEYLEAFENAVKERREFSCYAETSKRDYSLEVKPAFNDDGSDDGVLAWLSAEYKGMGNGSYYIVINPKMAIHGEDD